MTAPLAQGSRIDAPISVGVGAHDDPHRTQTTLFTSLGEGGGGEADGGIVTEQKRLKKYETTPQACSTPAPLAQGSRIDAPISVGVGASTTRTVHKQLFLPPSVREVAAEPTEGVLLSAKLPQSPIGDSSPCTGEPKTRANRRGDHWSPASCAIYIRLPCAKGGGAKHRRDCYNAKNNPSVTYR